MKYAFKPRSAREKFAVKIVFLLVENFFPAYLVGGTVRDLLLGKKITDIDIATSATPAEVAYILKKHSIPFDASHARLGSVRVQSPHEVAITTFRRDLRSDNRYPNVQFVRSPREDSSRRDFTVNSLYLSPKTGELLDFHHGRRDVTHRRLRFIGRPEKRIQEDPLRMLRAIRFAGDLGFVIETGSAQAIRRLRHLVSALTSSRMEKEISKSKRAATKKYLKKFLELTKPLDKKFFSA